MASTSGGKQKLTNADRTRICRAKLKQNNEKYNDNKEKDRLRKKDERSKKTLTDEEKEAKRRKDREYKARQRQREKKQQNDENEVNTPTMPACSSTPFSNENSLAKAVSRTKRSMPNSPQRQAAVLGRILGKLTPTKRQIAFDHTHDPKARRQLITCNKKRRSDAIQPETIKLVEMFYQQDDISRMCPGRKDFISVKTENGRVHYQKRLILMNISEAHQLFVQQHGDIIGLSKFAEFRPPFVVPMTEKDQDVCLCKYHENISLLAIGLNKNVPTLPTNSDLLVKETLCNFEDEECINRLCINCGPVLLDHYFNNDNNRNEVTYYQWTTVDGKITKQSTTTSVHSAVTELYSQLQKFSRHVYDAKRQHVELKHLKTQLQPGNIILHEDFAENYTIKHQNEIMSAHWATESITLFTAIIYYRPSIDAELKHISYTVVSDLLSHGKCAVHAFNAKIIDDVKSKLPWDVNKIHYWSDGCASQFKNRYNFGNLVNHRSNFGCDADWNFFATAHGKGPIDGIGGEVKRCVWRSVLQGKEVIGNSKQFYDLASKLCPKITLLMVTSEQVEEATNDLQKIWDKCMPVSGIQGFHYICVKSDTELQVATNSPFTRSQPLIVKSIFAHPTVLEKDVMTESVSNDMKLKVKVGDFVKVKYVTNKSDKLFAGYVLRKEQNECEIKFMRPSDANKTVYVFPNPDDISWIDESQITSVLDIPSMDNRNRYMFNADVCSSEEKNSSS